MILCTIRKNKMETVTLTITLLTYFNIAGKTFLCSFLRFYDIIYGLFTTESRKQEQFYPHKTKVISHA